MPKIVFSGTAIAVASSVTLNACTVLGSEIAFQAPSASYANVRQTISPSGASRITTRYPSATKRSDELTARSCFVAKRRTPPRSSSTAKEIASRTTETAAAPSVSPLVATR